jgi:hypothetical protein
MGNQVLHWFLKNYEALQLFRQDGRPCKVIGEQNCPLPVGGNGPNVNLPHFSPGVIYCQGRFGYSCTSNLNLEEINILSSL